MKYTLLALGLIVVLAFVKYGQVVPEGAISKIDNIENTGSALLTSIKSGGLATSTLKIGKEILNIEIADTAEARTLGLSGRLGLATSTGLLFVFEQEAQYGFWMKDMNFPIDIAWLDKDKKIVYIEENASPESYLRREVFTPATPAMYVLETPAFFFQNSKIKIGDIAEF